MMKHALILGALSLAAATCLAGGSSPPSISLSQTCPTSPANINDGINYQYTVKNTGSASISKSRSYSIQVTVVLDANLKYVGGAGGSWSCPAAYSNSPITCQYKSKVKKNKSTNPLTITALTPASIPATNSGKVTSSATATYSSITTASQSCTTSLTNPTPGYFNVVDAAGSCANTAINTKVAGSQDIALKITALNTSKQIDTTFNGPAYVYLMDFSSLTVSSTATNCPSVASLGLGTNNRPSTYLATATATLASGVGTVTLPTVNNAYRKVGVFVVGSGAPYNYACSIDAFAIRPSHFNVAVTDADWQTAGTTRSLAASSGNVHAAGRPFTVTATAVSAANAGLTGYSGLGASYFYSNDGTDDFGIVPTLDVNAVTSPAGGSPGDLAGAFKPTGSAGQVQATDATYQEAGSFELLVQDDVFAMEDAKNSCSSVTDRRIQNNTTVSVGRFVPNLLTITDINAPSFKTACYNAGGTSFSYVGQPIAFNTVPSFNVRAWGYDDEAPVPLDNYVASGRLTVGNSGRIDGYTATPSTLALDTTQTGNAVFGSSIGTDSGGASVTLNTVTVNPADSLIFTRNAATPLAPFTANVKLSIPVSDCSDKAATNKNACLPVCLDTGNAYQGTPGTCGTGTSATVTYNGSGSGIAFDNGGSVRYGYLSLPATASVANGTTNLNLTMEAKYWTGSAWATNTLDNCSTVPAASIALSNFTKNLAACESIVSTSASKLSAGASTLTLGAPGAANTGSVDVSPNLGSSASSNYSCATSTPTAASATNLGWLQCNSSYLSNCVTNGGISSPKTTATFNGTPTVPNRTRYLYMREMY